DNTIRLWDAGMGKPVGEPLRGHTSSVSSVSFSPDGTRIVTGSSDHTIRLWDAGTGKPVGEPLRGHTGSVNSVSFSPDSTRIVTGSWDRTVRLWDAGMKQPLQQCAQLDLPSLSDERRKIEPTATMKLNNQNNHSIRFSSTPLTSFFLNHDNGWVVGPKNQLLFWVPPASRHGFYNPATTLVIPRGGPELDLRCMAHGQHWHKCREE
ncbi:WD40 repeat-like protein, partial [Suillus hirtellus]